MKLLLVLTFFSSTLLADTMVKVQNVQHNSRAKQSSSIVFMKIRTGQLRIDHKTGYMLYDDKDKSVTILDVKKKKYFKLDETRIDQMNNKMKAARKKMQAELEKMPPEKRKMIEQYMGNMQKTQNDNEELSVTFKKLGSSEKCSRWTCRKMAEMTGTLKTREIWVADARELKMPESDYQTLVSMNKSFKKLSETLPQAQVPSVIFDFEKIGGIPVVVESWENGNVVRSATIVDIKEEKFGKSLFEIPKDFKEGKL